MFQRDAFVGIKGEACVALGGFALSAGKGVFFAGYGMQKHGEIFAHGLIALPQQFIGIRAHHHPIAVFNGQTKQLIAHRAANQINLHQITPKKVSGCMIRQPENQHKHLPTLVRFLFT